MSSPAGADARADADTRADAEAARRINMASPRQALNRKEIERTGRNDSVKIYTRNQSWTGLRQ